MATHVPDRTHNQSIDTLRAIACIALVSFHVVGYASNSGLELPKHHWLHLMNDSLLGLRMPLFSFLSGLVFIALERTTKPTRHIVLSKMRRLWLPMLSVGVLFCYGQSLMGQTPPALLSLPFLPFGHFWFLQATLLIMVTFISLCAIKPGHSVTLASWLLLVSAVWWLIGPRLPINLFSLNQALYLMPFFMLGYLCQHIGQIRMHVGVGVCVVIGLIGCGYALASEVLILSGVSRRALLLAIGATGCVTLWALAPRHVGLARLGRYSYAVYLFHVFFTAGTRECLWTIWPALPTPVLWVMGLAAGLIGPILVSYVLMQTRYGAWLFLGLRLEQPARSVAPFVAQGRQAEGA